MSYEHCRAFTFGIRVRATAGPRDGMAGRVAFVPSYAPQFVTVEWERSGPSYYPTDWLAPILCPECSTGRVPERGIFEACERHAGNESTAAHAARRTRP